MFKLKEANAAYPEIIIEHNKSGLWIYFNLQKLYKPSQRDKL